MRHLKSLRSLRVAVPHFPCLSSVQLPYLPAARSECVFLTSGYEAHIKRQRPPPEAKPAELPKLPARTPWASAEKARVEEVCACCSTLKRPVSKRYEPVVLP